jgi:hypothetical protein
MGVTSTPFFKCSGTSRLLIGNIFVVSFCGINEVTSLIPPKPKTAANKSV